MSQHHHVTTPPPTKTTTTKPIELNTMTTTNTEKASADEENPLVASAINDAIDTCIQHFDQAKKTISILQDNQYALAEENKLLQTKIKQRQQELKNLEQQIIDKKNEAAALIIINNNIDEKKDDEDNNNINSSDHRRLVEISTGRKKYSHIKGTTDDSSSSTTTTTTMESLLHHVANVFRSKVKVSDNNNNHRTFTGKDAIDFILDSNFANSRNDAINLLQTFANKPFYMFKSLKTTGNYNELSCNEFKDILFYFVESNSGDNNNSSNNATTTTESSTTITDFSQDDGRRHEEKEKEEEINLTDIAKTFQKGVPIKDHSYRFKTYKGTFVASEAVDFLCSSGIAKSRQEAVQIGNMLMKELNLFEHVTGEHYFKDEYLFFRFKSESSLLPEKSFKKSLWDSQARSFRRIKSSLTDASTSSFETELSEIAEQFRLNVAVQDHMYRDKTYRNCFTGSEGIDYLTNNFADTRIDAVEIGNALISFGLFEHASSSVATTKDHNAPAPPPFADSEHVFFRFMVEDVDNCRICRLSDTARNIVRKSTMIPFQKQKTRASVAPEKTRLADSLYATKMEEIAEQFRDGVTVSDHTYRDKTHRNCFVGSEAVDFLLNSNLADDRKNAVEIGNFLMVEFNLFEHVYKEHNFKDEYLFYYFPKQREQSTRKSLSYGRMNLNQDGLILSREEIEEKRLRFGYCLTCDENPVHLYEIQKSKLNPLASTKKPLTTEGECVNGQCLRCNPHLNDKSVTRFHSMGPGGLPTTQRSTYPSQRSTNTSMKGPLRISSLDRPTYP